MGMQPCSNCGHLRSNSIVSSAGTHISACSDCGDPCYTEPHDSPSEPPKVRKPSVPVLDFSKENFMSNDVPVSDPGDVKTFSVLGRDSRTLNVILGRDSAEIVTHAMAQDDTQEDRVLICRISKYELIGLAYDILNSTNEPKQSVSMHYHGNGIAPTKPSGFPGIPNE